MKTKKAFSLIEVVFVLVILGIVASISSQIIVQVYENYIIQKAIYKVNNQTEIVANQLVNRLTYRIEQYLKIIKYSLIIIKMEVQYHLQVIG